MGKAGADWIFSSNRGKTLDRSPRGPAGRFLETAGTGGNALGANGGGGHQFDYVLAGALRTFGRGIRWRQNQIFKTVTTAFTLIFIDRHRSFLLQKNIFIDGFVPLVKIKPLFNPNQSGTMSNNCNYGLFIIFPLMGDTIIHRDLLRRPPIGHMKASDSCKVLTLLAEQIDLTWSEIWIIIAIKIHIREV
jgi:hypothetical protein